MASIAPASAQQTVWTNIGTSGFWTNLSTWVGSSAYPNGTDVTAFFNANMASIKNVTNNVAVTNGTLRFTTAGSQGFNVYSSGTSRIYLNASSGTALVEVTTNSVALNQLIIPVTLLSSLVVSNQGNLYFAGTVGNGGNAITVAGAGNTYFQQAVTDGGGLVKSGTGNLILTGTNTYTGGTLVSGGVLVGTTAGIQGGVTNNAAVVFNNTAGGTYGGVMSGSGALTISNTSGIAVLLTNQNTYTGGTLVQQGGLTLSNSFGMIGNTAAVTLMAGTTLLLDNRGVSNFNRISGVPLTMQGATLLVLGGGTNNLGSITLGTGGSVISNVASVISGAAFSRGAGNGTVNFTGSGANLFATQEGSSNAILPWAFVKGADFATHDGNGTALRAFTNYSTSFAADANVKATTVNSVEGMAINSLVLGTNLTIGAGQTLTNTSGGMIFTLANQFVTNGSLRFSAEAILENEAAATVYSTLATPSGLTKTGAGTLTLLGSNQNAGGTLRVNQGSLTVGEGGVVDGGDVLVNVGTFGMNGGAATLNSLVVTSATPSATANLTLGYGTLTTTNGFFLNNNASFLVGGVSGKAMVLNMLGGTNVTGTAGSSFSFTVGGAVSAFNTGVVVVAGPSTVWSNGMGLWVGGNLSVTTHTNSLGQVFISNGATVYVTSGSLVNNTAGLAIGGYTAGSSLTLADGGRLYYTGASAVRVGANPSSSNNTILVTGAGSVLDTGTNRPINIGYSGSVGGGNLITVSSSGKVVTAGLAIGGQFNSSGTGTGSDPGAGSNNTVVVQDSGTIWSNANVASSTYVGLGGAGNRLVVSNQAVFASMGAITVALTAGGTSNQLLVLDGGRVSASSVIIGGAANANGNSVVVSGGSFLMSTGALVVGNNVSAVGSQLVISNGGKVYSGGNSYLGTAKGATLGRVLLTGNGSIWTNTSLLFAGQSNVLQVLDQAVFQGFDTTMGDLSSGTMSSNNIVVVANQGVWTNLGSLNVGQYGNGDQFLVTNGGTAYVAANVSVGKINAVPNAGQLVTNNLLLVSDPTSRMTIGASLLLGDNNQQVLLPGVGYVVVSNGAQMVVGNVYVSGRSNVNACVLDLSGPGSLLRTTAFYVGRDASVSSGSNGLARISSGATLDVADLRASANNAISNSGGTFQFSTISPTVLAGTSNSIVLTNGTIAFRDAANVNIKGNWGAGSAGRYLTNITFSGDNSFRLNNSSTTNSGSDYVFAAGRGATNYTRLEMVNGSTLWQGGSLSLGSGGSLLISNTTANFYGAFTNLSGTATVVNASATYWSNAVLNGGAYLAFSGTNAFNAGLTINPGATMTMDAFSTLTGTVSNNSALQILSNAVYVLGAGQGGLAGSGAMTISSGGALLITGGTFAVGNAVTNSGTINVVNGQVTYAAPVVINGLYSSDPSTNTFVTNVTVAASGALQGSNGDLFVFQKDLLMLSTNKQFDVSRAGMLFTNGTQHTLSISNSGARDIGAGYTNFSQVASNFAIGTLSIASGDRLTLTGNKSGATTNALYVGWLDIQGWSTNGPDPYLSVSNSLVSALNLTDVNLYYDFYDARNNWLNDWIPETGYALWGPGAGMLLPIPEASTWIALGGGLALLTSLRRRRAG